MSLYSSIAALLVSVAFTVAGNGLITTLIPLRAKLEGFPELTIGLLGSSYFAGMLAGTLAAPAIVRRAGHIRGFCALVSVAIVMALACPAFVRPEPWIAVRAIMGFAFAGLYAVIDSWVNAKSTNENRGRIYAVYQLVNFAASAVGQQLLGVDDPKGFLLFSLVGALFALAVLPLSFTRVDPPGEPGSIKLRLGWLYGMAPVGVAGAFVCGAANGSLWSLAPVYGLGVGLTTAGVSAFMTAVVVGSALVVYPIGQLSDRMDRRVLLVVCAGVACLFEASLTLVGAPGEITLIALGAGIGMSAMVIYSLAASHANDRIGPLAAMETASGLLFLYCVGAILFPTIGAALMNRFGVPALFAQNAALHGGLAVFAAWRILQRAKAQPAPREARNQARRPL